MNKIFKSLIICAMGMLLVMPAVSFAALNADDLTGGVDIGGITELSEADPRTIAAKLINVALGFLGIIAVVMILIGGFKWMTAGGNEEQTGEARKIIVSAVIGLAIILASWGLTNFVLGALTKAID